MYILKLREKKGSAVGEQPESLTSYFALLLSPLHIRIDSRGQAHA